MSAEVELAKSLSDALSAAVPLGNLQKCLYHVHVSVLQDDGSTLPAIICAASLALTNAGMEVNDLVCSCSVACMAMAAEEKDGTATTRTPLLLADPTTEEALQADALVTLAVLPNLKEVTLWEQTGKRALSSEQSSNALELCRDGCRSLHKFMKQSLIESHEPQRA